MTPADHFPAAVGLTWAEVGGGLSGARVWRGDDAGAVPRAALKQLPDGFPADRLRQVHEWMRAARLAVVPAVFDAGSDTVLEHGGRVWECLAWVAGEPLLGRPPTRSCGLALGGGQPPDALKAAYAALAALHRAWAPVAQPAAPPPCVARRRSLYAEVAPHLSHPPSHLRRAVAVLHSNLPAAIATLAPLVALGPVQPCLCDPRPEHFLFTGDALTGVIDYAAMKADHPAVDLARLLLDTGFLEAGVAAYHAAAGTPAVTVELVRALADTGRVGAVANWVLRLRHREPTPAEAARLERLLEGMVH